jgi:hypothetical protein
MRDIRNDLRERLASVAARYVDEIDEHNQKLKSLEKSHEETLTGLARERAAVEQLLAIEDERAGIPALTLAQKLAVLVPLGDFLVMKVQHHGPMQKEQLRAEARLAGYLPDGNARVFHITLMNVTKCGRLVHLPDGRYAFRDCINGKDAPAVACSDHKLRPAQISDAIGVPKEVWSMDSRSGTEDSPQMNASGGGNDNADAED